jgi:hypothetical protein
MSSQLTAAKVKLTFHQRRQVGLRISGKVHTRPEQDPKYDKFAKGLQARNSMVVFPLKRHPLESEALKWTMTDQMKQRPDRIPRETQYSVPFLVIQNERDFKDMMSHLITQDLLAFDMEMNVYKGYYTNYAAMLQISSTTRDFLICPFLLHDQIPQLWEITEDPKIMKLLFDARNDVKACQFQWKLFFVGLMDMQLAYMEFFPKIGESDH